MFITIICSENPGLFLPEIIIMTKEEEEVCARVVYYFQKVIPAHHDNSTNKEGRGEKSYCFRHKAL